MATRLIEVEFGERVRKRAAVLHTPGKTHSVERPYALSAHVRQVDLAEIVEVSREITTAIAWKADVESRAGRLLQSKTQRPCRIRRGEDVHQIIHLLRVGKNCRITSRYVSTPGACNV